MEQPAIISLTQRLRRLHKGDGLRAQLLRGGGGSALIQGSSRILTLALGIMLARCLGPDRYGVYAYAFAIMSLLMVVAEVGVPTLLMREVAVSRGRSEWGLLRGALIRAGQLVSIVSTLVSITGLLVLWFIANQLNSATLYTTALMLLVLPTATLTKTLAHAMLGLHRVVVGQAVYMLLRPTLVLLAISVAFFAFPALREPHYAMAAQFGAALLVLIVGIWMLSSFLPDQVRMAPAQYRTNEWLRSAGPFMLIGGAGIINSQVDVIMLGWFREAVEVGVYRVAVQGATVVAFGLHIANVVVGPYFARFYAQGDMARLQRMVTASARVILLAALPITVIFIFFGDMIVGAIFGLDFKLSYVPLAILSAGWMFNLLFGPIGTLLRMTGQEWISARIMIASVFANISLNLLLVPLYGTIGAASATACTLAVSHAFLFILAKKKSGLNSFVFVKLNN